MFKSHSFNVISFSVNESDCAHSMLLSLLDFLEYSKKEFCFVNEMPSTWKYFVKYFYDFVFSKVSNKSGFLRGIESQCTLKGVHCTIYFFSGVILQDEGIVHL